MRVLISSHLQVKERLCNDGGDGNDDHVKSDIPAHRPSRRGPASAGERCPTCEPAPQAMASVAPTPPEPRPESRGHSLDRRAGGGRDPRGLIAGPSGATTGLGPNRESVLAAARDPWPTVVPAPSADAAAVPSVPVPASHLRDAEALNPATSAMKGNGRGVTFSARPPARGAILPRLWVAQLNHRSAQGSPWRAPRPGSVWQPWLPGKRVQWT